MLPGKRQGRVAGVGCVEEAQTEENADEGAEEKARNRRIRIMLKTRRKGQE